jgi:gluconolactonase
MSYLRPLLVALLLLACSGSDPAATSSEEGGGGGGETGSGGTPGRGGKGGTATGGAEMGGAPGGGGTTPAEGGAPGMGGASLPDGGGDDAVSPPDMPPVAPAVCPAGPFEAPKAGPSEGICPGFNVKYNWNEGPTWVPSQKAFFFSNFTIMQAGPGDMIKYDPAANKCEVFIAGNGCNGLAGTPDGKSIYAACQTPRALMKYDIATKMGTVLVDMVEGKKLDSPNDIALHSNGTIYFSNATFELGGRPQGLGTALLRVDPMGMVHVIAKGGINPLGLSPDQKRLYAMGGYWNVDDNGVPTTKAGGFTLGNDGIAIDCAGNVYTNSGAIIGPNNQRVGSFNGGTNQAFGGEDGKTLLVVGGKNMHIHKMNLPGLPQ